MHRRICFSSHVHAPGPHTVRTHTALTQCGLDGKTGRGQGGERSFYPQVLSKVASSRELIPILDREIRGCLRKARGTPLEQTEARDASGRAVHVYPPFLLHLSFTFKSPDCQNFRWQPPHTCWKVLEGSSIQLSVQDDTPSSLPDLSDSLGPLWALVWGGMDLRSLRILPTPPASGIAGTREGCTSWVLSNWLGV